MMETLVGVIATIIGTIIGIFGLIKFRVIDKILIWLKKLKVIHNKK